MAAAVPLETLESLLEAERYAVLLELLDEQITEETTDHRHLRLLAKALHFSRKSKEALEVSQLWALLAEDPTEALLMISHLNFLLDDPLLCLEAAQAAMEHARGSDLDRAYGLASRAMQAQGKFEDALALVDERLTVSPNSADLCFAKALSCSHIGDPEQACSLHRQALELDPTWLPPKVELANELYRLGQYHEATEAYEARWYVEEAKIGGRLHPTIPIWDGIAFNGTLLLWREQGLGDEIFYLGFLEQIHKLHAELIVEVDVRILCTCIRSFPNIRFVPLGANLSSFNISYALPMGSIPRILLHNGVELPIRRQPYLTAPTPLHSPFAGTPEQSMRPPRIGLAWRSDRGLIGKFKSVSLHDLEPVFSAGDYRFVSLQHGDTQAEIAEFRSIHKRAEILTSGLDVFNDIDELASQIHTLDAVITVSCSVAHLAPALGVPTYVLLPKGRGLLWYWGRKDTRSRWYETAQLFRQNDQMSWKVAVEQLTRALTEQLQTRTSDT